MKGHVWLILLAIPLISHCGLKYTMPTPKGFVRYEKEKAHIKAISADGVRLMTFEHKNEPEGDLVLWTQQFRQHFADQGYKILKEQAVLAKNNLAGHYFHTLYSFNGRDFSYAVTVFVHEKQVYTVEAGSEFAVYAGEEESVLAAVKEFGI